MFWKRSVSVFTASAVALAAILVLALPVWADDPGVTAWLAAQQNADGGFGSPESAVGITADVVIAATAAGAEAIDWQVGGASAGDYLSRNAASIVAIGDLSKTIVALTASGVHPRDFGGVDLIARLEGALAGCRLAEAQSIVRRAALPGDVERALAQLLGQVLEEETGRSRSERKS